MVSTRLSLLRVLGVAFGVAAVVGGMVGQGILRTPGIIAGAIHSPELILALWAMGGKRDHVDVFGTDYPTSDGTCIRDYIHVSDLAEAHLLALEATAPGDPRTAEPLVCNLGNGGGFSVREVIAATERATGRQIRYRVGPRRAGDPPVLVAQADRAAEILGWRPARPSLDAMVESAWAWQLAHPVGYKGEPS